MISSKSSSVTANQRIALKLKPYRKDSVHVKILGRYNDFDYDGNGVSNEWQYGIENGVYKNIIGEKKLLKGKTETGWDNTLIPDQKSIALGAIITGVDSISYFVKPLEDRTHSRHNSKVEMFQCDSLHPWFCSRLGKVRRVRISLPDIDTSKIVDAKLLLSSWSAIHRNEPGSTIKLNGVIIGQGFGKEHATSVDTFALSKSILKSGDNHFSIISDTNHHMAEVNWPGPALVITFKDQ